MSSLIFFGVNNLLFKIEEKRVHFYQLDFYQKDVKKQKN